MISHRPTLKRLLAEASGKNIEDMPEMDEEGWAGLSRFAYLLARELGARPIRMVLHCPACGTQHIDVAEPFSMHDQIACSLTNGRSLRCTCDHWNNPPHKSHLCSECGHVWRPCDQETTGVAALLTRGKDDSPPLDNLVTIPK